MQQLIGKFFKLLQPMQALKVERRRLYRQISGLKKSWFGYLVRLVRDRAKAHNVFAVREDLGPAPEPKRSPKYKGRFFRRMIANGGRQQYQKRQSDGL